MKKLGLIVGLAVLVLGAAVLEGTAAQVDLYVDGQLVGTTTSMTYSWNTRTLANGDHTLTAIYRDDAGRMISSDPVRVKVYNPAAGGSLGSQAPLLTLTVGSQTRATLGASEGESRALLIESRGASQSVTLSSDVAEASIVDLKGRTVWQRRGDGSATIGGNMGPSGLYILSIRENSGDMHRFRVVVVR